MKTYPENDIRFMGPLKPARYEAIVDDCIVEGEIPKELNGGFYRAGPTWKRHTRQDVRGTPTMDGMIYGLIFKDGKATHINKWVRTPKYLLEEKYGEALVEYYDHWEDWRGYGQFSKDHIGAVTDGQPMGALAVNAVPFYADTGVELLSVAEQGLPPIALDPLTLETKGRVDWEGQLSPGMSGYNTFTAHPKWDPQTGELYGMTYNDEAPYLVLHHVQSNGTVNSLELNDAPYATLAHDIWLSENYVIIPFQPFYVDRERVFKQELPSLGWNPELPVYVAVVRRDLTGGVRYIKGDFCAYIMHTLSANEDGDKIYLEGPVYERAPFPFEDRVEKGVDYVPYDSAVDGRYIVDLAADTLTCERFNDRLVEFPKVDERFYGRGFQHGWLVAGENLWSLDCIIYKNVKTGEQQEYKFSYDHQFAVFEPTFAPRVHDSPEGDGYLVVPVSLFEQNLFEYVIFDALNLSNGPVATIKLPFQAGWTPHGHWVDFDGLQAAS